MNNTETFVDIDTWFHVQAFNFLEGVWENRSNLRFLSVEQAARLARDGDRVGQVTAGTGIVH